MHVQLTETESMQTDVAIPADMVAAMRSNHAGETGAVWIYRGIRAFTNNAQLREFAKRHQLTEEHHLQIMEDLLPRAQRSKLLFLWRAAGWSTGALPALFGPGAVYCTIDAVESFVDQHYLEQIETLQSRPQDQALKSVLESCRDDELLHRDEARQNSGPTGGITRVWQSLVGAGSRIGVYIASRI